MNDLVESAMNIRFRLDNLRAEHRELDEAIDRLCATENSDQLMMQRLKKRKLIVKDRIVIIEQSIGANSQA